MFQHRDICHPLILHKIGNGEPTFVWLDYWHPLGLLYMKYGNGVCSDFGSALDAKVSETIPHVSWRWPSTRNRCIPEVCQHTPCDFVPYIPKENSMVWTPSGCGMYTMKSAWNALRIHCEIKT